jgi:hypothetical protein
LSQPRPGVDAKVLIALRTNVQVFFQIFFPNNLPATLTLYPKTLGANFLRAGSVQFPGLSFEPSHKNRVVSKFGNRNQTESQSLRFFNYSMIQFHRSMAAIPLFPGAAFTTIRPRRVSCIAGN